MQVRIHSIGLVIYLQLQTIVNLIANTTTTTGLTVRCELDPNLYPTKIKLTDQQKKSIPLARHEFHGDWNYSIEPQLE